MEGLNNRYGLRMRKRVIVDPAGEDRRFHRHNPRLRKGPYPAIQLIPGCADRSFPVHLTARILYTVADRLLVNIKADVIHIVSEEPPRLFSESAGAEFSLCNTSCSSSRLTFKQLGNNPKNGSLPDCPQSILSESGIKRARNQGWFEKVECLLDLGHRPE